MKRTITAYTESNIIFILFQAEKYLVIRREVLKNFNVLSQVSLVELAKRKGEIGNKGRREGSGVGDPFGFHNKRDKFGDESHIYCIQVMYD